LVPPEERIPVEAGMNRFAWDLRYDGPHKLPGDSDAIIDNELSQRAHEALGYEVVDRCVHYRKRL
jgi:hypothetical protein